MRLRTRYWPVAAAVLAAMLVMPDGPARADEFTLGGIIFGNVREIVAVDGPGGRITFVYQGRQMTRPLDGLQSMDLARCPLLGQAFKSAKAGRDDEAATMFGQVAASAPEQWIGTLATGQMVGPADRAGRFGDAVSAYIAWLNAGWPAPKIDPPGNLPQRDGPQLLLGIRLLEKGIESAQSDETKLKLRVLLLKAYQRQGDDRAVELSRTLLQESDGRGGESLGMSVRDNALLAPVRQAVAGNDFDAALERARQAGRTVSRDALAELFMLAGQSYEHKEDAIRAALCYMRLVIHFPKDRQTPEAMLRSARLSERLGRADSARMLYETLSQRYPGTPQAASAKAALTGKKE